MMNRSTPPIWKITKGHSPVVAAAIHDGHQVRGEVSRILALTDAERLREEDPFTALWTEVAETRIIGLQSRFEVDLNRPREKAVYITPEDAWGLRVWQERPDEHLISRSLAGYDAFLFRGPRPIDRDCAALWAFCCFRSTFIQSSSRGAQGPTGRSRR